MEKVIEEIKRLASNRDWSLIDDQMKSRNEKSICFEIVESTLNKLRNEY